MLSDPASQRESVVNEVALDESDATVLKGNMAALPGEGGVEFDVESLDVGVNAGIRNAPSSTDIGSVVPADRLSDIAIGSGGDSVAEDMVSVESSWPSPAKH